MAFICLVKGGVFLNKNLILYIEEYADNFFKVKPQKLFVDSMSPIQKKGYTPLVEGFKKAYSAWRMEPFSQELREDLLLKISDIHKFAVNYLKESGSGIKSKLSRENQVILNSFLIDVIENSYRKIEREIRNSDYGFSDSFDKKFSSLFLRISSIYKVSTIKRKNIGEKKWELWSKDGKKLLGRFKTLKEAKERERQIQAIKYLKNKRPARKYRRNVK